jgi:hypothetical protein
MHQHRRVHPSAKSAATTQAAINAAATNATISILDEGVGV